MHKRIILILALTISSIICLAQGRVGSPYTRYGLGDVNQNSLIRNNAMGRTSYTLPYNNGINFINPALVSQIDTMTFIFDFGFNGGIRTYKTETQGSMSNYDFQISHLIFGFPITKWWKSCVGFMPYSNVAYSIVDRDSSLNVAKDYIYSGNGGLNQVAWSNGFTPFKNFSIGINAFYYFGKIYHSNSIDFDDKTGAFLNVIEQNTVRINDFSFDLGMNYNINLNPENKLSISGVYAYNSQLNAVRNTMVFNTLSHSSAITDTIFQSINEKGKISLAQKIGVGIGYNHDDKLYVGVDYTIQDWSKAKYFELSDQLSNSTFISVGTEYTPAGRSKLYYKYWQGVSYRAGFYSNQNFINLNNSETKISDFGISFGLGLPTKRSKTSYNLSLQIGQRGSAKNNFITENYFIIGLSLNLADMWFIKSKFD
ncbi:MAG: hypothetical protein QM212_09445 [Bacteroidota bacterium]|jgi:hypothetical protein|nr:hypothetical protein [Bacteroidales bacterium]MDI9536189.1 hypothetical protein [Bacteroidota bacterium]OQC45432.1 MAG: hypothetical protein BWX59_01226 [Bacteroidetes bacterium ADurb.Bin028]NLP19659.1 hypothetical protein [Bacteroidales bacterium]HOE38087.1 hypothetical protein [Bacteroidales bacterium]